MNLACFLNTIYHIKMADLKRSDIQKVAELAKLNLNKKEIELYSSQLSQVVGFVNNLSEVDTKDIQPTSQPTGLENIYSQDKVDQTQTLDVSDAISQANKTHNNYFVVDAVLQKDQ